MLRSPKAKRVYRRVAVRCVRMTFLRSDGLCYFYVVFYTNRVNTRQTRSSLCHFASLVARRGAAQSRLVHRTHSALTHSQVTRALAHKIPPRRRSTTHAHTQTHTLRYKLPRRARATSQTWPRGARGSGQASGTAATDLTRQGGWGRAGACTCQSPMPPCPHAYGGVRGMVVASAHPPRL